MRWSSLVALAVGFGATPACTCDSQQVPAGEAASAAAVAALTGQPPIEPDLLPPGQTPQSALPIVDLEGHARDYAVTLVDTAPQRVYSRALRAWVYERAARSSAQLGYLRTGGSAPISGPAVGSSECSGGWQPIKPRGFVCMNDQVTYDVTDPIVELTRESPRSSDVSCRTSTALCESQGRVMRAYPNEPPWL